MVSSSSSAAGAAPNHGDAPSSKLTTAYHIVMTPVIFVSFLASLAWVEFRYSLMRSHSHSESPSSLPGWLHHVVYREAPYRYVQVVDNGSGGSGSRPTSPRTNGGSASATKASTSEDGTRWYYHSKQRKLMKMEVHDAFEIRGTVLMAMGLLALLFTWALWRVGWLILSLARVRSG